MNRHCRCEQCSATPDPRYTRAHLAACEARFVMTLQPARRRQYFDAVERRRGLRGLLQLKYEIAKLPPPPL